METLDVALDIVPLGSQGGSENERFRHLHKSRRGHVFWFFKSTFRHTFEKAVK